MPRDSILVADRNPKFLEKTREILDEVDHRMLEATDGEEARLRLTKDRPAIVMANVVLPTLSGFDLTRDIKTSHDEALPVILMLANDDSDSIAQVYACGADNYLVRPLKRAELLFCIRDMVRLRSLLLERKSWRESAERGEGGQGSVSSMTGTPGNSGDGIDASTQFYQFEFFKRLISIELKRAQRYAFPLSILLISVDDKPELSGPEGAELQREVMAGLAQAIRKSIRDIDVPVTFNDGNVLVLMPHTDLEGAMVVAKRIHARVRKSAYRASGVEVRPTVSIGATSSRRVERLTFPALMQRVTQGLREARRGGGDSVVSS